MPDIPTEWLILVGSVGLCAGWLAGLLLGGGGLIRNLIVGVLGAIVGGSLVRLGFISVPFTTGNNFGDQVIVATIGALIVVILARIVAR